MLQAGCVLALFSEGISAMDWKHRPSSRVRRGFIGEHIGVDGEQVTARVRPGPVGVAGQAVELLLSVCRAGPVLGGKPLIYTRAHDR